MAGDWIKIEHALPDKPEVMQMADLLGIDPDAVVGKLLRFWNWCDVQCVNGDALSVTKTFLDRVTFCKNFAEAMIRVGWLVDDGETLSIANFDRHNGKTSKLRALANRRMAKSRSCDAPSVTNVTAPASQKASPEKRREEKRRGGGEEEAAPPPLDFEKDPEKPFNPHRMATFEQVQSFGKGQLPPVSDECCEGFFDRMEADGWINSHGHPLADWRARFRQWVTAWARNADGARRAAR